MNRTITAVYEVRGKRKRLIGFKAEYAGHTFPILFGSFSEAEKAIDAYAYEALTHGGA